MANKILVFSFLFSFLIISCDKKKEVEKKQVLREVVKQPVIKKDSIPTLPEPAQEPEVAKPDNKYFLIAGSFSIEQNAIAFKNTLIEQGYDSEIILRYTNKSSKFYKVSYKGFLDKEEAFNQLSHERKQPNNENVWLLIKK